MANQDSFPVGKAPWEQDGSADPHPDSFPAGKAPWETSESSGLLSSALEKVAAVGKAIDSYTGAPTRAAVSAAQKGENPIPAFSKQFGEDPGIAPTGKDIAMKAGLSDQGTVSMTAADRQAFDEKHNPGFANAMKKAGIKYEDLQSPSPAAVAGVGVDLGADVTNLIPTIGALKSLKGAEAASESTKVAAKSGLIDAMANKLKATAEDLAVNSTGATSKQASTFADDAGRQLLDRGVVRFGDSQKKIASRAAEAMDAANNQIDSALKNLQAQGVKVDANKIYDAVQSKINKLKGDPSQADIAKLLNNEIENVINASDLKGTEVGILDAEQTKRGYQRKAGNWADPEKGIAGKEMYQTYRGAVEDAATAADPETAALFKEGKKSYGLMAPIQEAAERRALSASQSQHGGLIDVATSVAGESAGGPVMAVAAPVARRIIGPRIASSLAVTADQAANALRKIPQFAQMETKNPAMFGAAVSRLTSAGDLSASKAAEQSAPQKGPAKWVNDGYQKLLDHAEGDDKKALSASSDQLMNSKNTKDLLISASDLKPGSKAMQNILEKVKQKMGEAK